MPTRRVLGVLAAVAAILTAAATPLWADSAAATPFASDFLADVKCPNPGTAPDYVDASPTDCFNPNASGTKFSGPLTVVYAEDATSGCVTNVFVNLTLQTGNILASVATEYLNGIRPHSTFAGCATDDQEHEQVATIIDLIRRTALPALYQCGAQCPPFFFQVKAITNYVVTAGHPPDTSDGFSADITIAVH